MRLRYRAASGASAGEPTERDFDPYGLAYRGGCWYAVGWCHLRGGLRSFRLDRIESVRVQSAGFSRPAGFDALAHLTFAVATLPRRHAVEVLLRTDLRTAQRELFPTIGDGGDRRRRALRGQCDGPGVVARELARCLSLRGAFTVELRGRCGLQRTCWPGGAPERAPSSTRIRAQRSRPRWST